MRNVPERPVVGVGAVVVDDDRVLLVRRAHQPLKGEWSLPGGAVELGETLEAAVAREVLEETGSKSRSDPSSRCSIASAGTPTGASSYHYVARRLPVPRDRRHAAPAASDAEDVAVGRAPPTLAGYGVADAGASRSSERHSSSTLSSLVNSQRRAQSEAASTPREVHRHAQQHDDQPRPGRRRPVDEQHQQDRRGADDVERRDDRIAERAIRADRRAVASGAAGRCRRWSGCRRSAPRR